MDFAVKIGSTKERKIRINPAQTTNFLWEGENVLSTPSLIAEMEETCRLLLKEQFISDPNCDSVGTLVEIKHIARYACRSRSSTQSQGSISKW